MATPKSQNRSSSSSEKERALSIIARMCRGKPPSVQVAVERLAELCGWRIADAAYLEIGNVGRKVNVVSGSGTPKKFKLQQNYIATGISGRAWFAEPTDDSAKLSMRWVSENNQGYIVGDNNEDYPFSLIAEHATFVALDQCIIVRQGEDHTVTIAADTLDGACIVAWGLKGYFVNGIG